MARRMIGEQRSSPGRSGIATGDGSLESTLRAVATQTSAVARRAPRTAPWAVSVVVLDRRGGSTTAGTVPDASVIDVAQLHDGSGPLARALADGRAHADARLDRQDGGALARVAAERGACGAAAVPLSLDGQVFGALSLYWSDPVDLEGISGLLADVTVHAESVVPVVASARALADATERAVHLETALRNQAVVERAKGILMQRDQLTAEQAFDVLRNRSQSRHEKLVAIAEQVVEQVEAAGARAQSA